MVSVQDRVSGLHVQQVQLYWVPRVHVAVRVEQSSLEEQGLFEVDALFADCAVLVEPFHCGGNGRVRIIQTI